MTDQFVPLFEDQRTGAFRRSIFIRAWNPGDGLTCSWAKSAKTTPCGPPVAVTVTESRERCWRDWCKGGCASCNKAVRRTVCQNHIPGLYNSGEVNAEARKAATERLAVEHWEDFQRYIDEETRSRREKAFRFADSEIRRIVLGESEERAS
jgi:hypothetical protein